MTGNWIDIFTKRGITPPWEPEGHVARAQGFERYKGATWRERRADLVAIDGRFDPRLDPDPSKWERRAREAADPDDREWLLMQVAGVRTRRRSWTGWFQQALAVDGWAMPRHAPMPDHANSGFAGKPWTHLRPDVPVGGHFERHSHRRLRGEARGREEAAPRTRHESSVCDLDRDGSVRGHYGLDLPDDVLPTGHLHPETGEVVVPREGMHAHWTHAKYLYTPGDTAKRLGANPLNVERQYEGDLFVVVLEGTLKMCAVTEAGYPCIDAGSVTLWGSQTEEAELDDAGNLEGGWIHELHEFAERHLRGRSVAVVCDSDWYANPMVRKQAENVAAILDPLVARAVACAPTEGKSYGWRHPMTGVEMRRKRGVDDWLGEHERADRRDALLELGFYARVRDAELATDDARLVGRSDGRRTTVDVVRAMGELASPVDRVAPYSVSRLAAMLERPESRVKDAHTRAVRAGLLEPLAPAERKSDGVGGFYTEPALVRVVPESMPRHEWRTLRQWLGE